MLWFILCQFVLFFLLLQFGKDTEAPLFSAKIHFFRKTNIKILIFAANNPSMKNRILTLFVISSLLFSACSSEKKTAFGEKEALEFLYAYMPLGDSVDYTEDYYRECIHYAFLAKEEMPWGASIPEREFKHFVVPVRVNNENLDRFRATYYEELKDRVKGLSLYDAVLEVFELALGDAGAPGHFLLG